jgi:N-acetylglucosamine-6-phosphate deacetylase
MRKTGFIDLQVNGYKGIDFNDPATTADDVLEAAAVLAATGTAGFLATVVTATRDAIEHNVATIAEAISRQGEHGNILGIHLEGPFLSSEYGYSGAHPRDCMSAPDLAWYETVERAAGGHIKIVTLAPEWEGTADFIRAVSPRAVVSAGHTCADYAQVRAAVDAGLRMATHIGNGCRQLIDRHQNIIYNLLASPEVQLCMITDGFHIPEQLMRLLLAVRPLDQLIVVSDTVVLGGMPPGAYPDAFAGQDLVIEPSGRLCLASDHEVMAGSTSNMTQCMNVLAALDALPEDALWQLSFDNPLRAIGIAPETFADRPGADVEYDPTSRTFHTIAG